ncbi:phosphodiester glycosidase family protein [Rodentibacter caecimuris]|uniref:Phosphodiester glycosidase domain-containing protein n=1 Tax=Rodentibacter caecimuris TaxID=1796644 RepID=A0ABX3KW35_9PAST|nr:hypothetical protein BKG89_07880 [Rodentibacter heylii]
MKLFGKIKLIKIMFFLTALCLMLSSAVSFANYRYLEDGNITYGIYQSQPEKIHLHWKDENGENYGFLTTLKKALKDTYQIKMLMNGGIYSKNNMPAGLWIENGRQLNGLNTRRGVGNFHVQPNGVFAIVDNHPYILTTSAYQKAGLKPRIALQSGPMLIINGVINRQFKPTLESFYKRNAVCLDKQNNVLFIMTIKGKPNLYNFSRGLLKIGCYHALYLDGNISDWYIPDLFSGLHWRRFVGMISVLEPYKK